MEENLVFNLKGNTYNINFPNIGDFRKIESLKQVLSNGMYGQLAGTNTKSAQHAADIVDIEATLTILCPDLVSKALESKSFQELGMKDFNELHGAYMDQFIPWWNKNLKEVGLLNQE